MAHLPLRVQAQHAYEAALDTPCPDWRAVAELFRAALRVPKPAKRQNAEEIADYNVDRIKLKCRSPRIAVRFMDGEAVFTHVPSASGKPLNVGRALRLAIAMYRSRRTVQQRLGFREYDRAMPVPDIFQVRCLETDELFTVEACNAYGCGAQGFGHLGALSQTQAIGAEVEERPMSKRKVKMVCSQCGSEDVFADSYAQWDVESQSWEIAQTFDKGAYCNKCDGETRIEEQS
jgi:hypothetical protein